MEVEDKEFQEKMNKLSNETKKTSEPVKSIKTALLNYFNTANDIFKNNLTMKGKESVSEIAKLIEKHNNSLQVKEKQLKYENNMPRTLKPETHEYGGKILYGGRALGGKKRKSKRRRRKRRKKTRRRKKGGESGEYTYYWCPSLNTTSYDPEMPCDVDVHSIGAQEYKQKGGKRRKKTRRHRRKTI